AAMRHGFRGTSFQTRRARGRSWVRPMRRLYDPDHWWFQSRRAVYLELLGAQLGALRVERALEIQSGEGGFLTELSDVAETICHTELDRRLLKRTAVRGHAGGVVATSRALPFASGAFDLVCWF